MKTRHITYLLSCFFTVILLSGCAKEEQIEENTETLASAAFEASAIDGTSVSEEIFSESKITMVNVWATYCNPCLSEMPGLGELADAYDPGDFKLIGIISDVTEDADAQTLQAASDLIEQTGANYPHLLVNLPLYTSFLTDVSAVPTTFFVNQEGEVVDPVVGAMEKSAWEEKINELLKD